MQLVHYSVLNWLVVNISEDEVKGKNILEVGSRNLNGSIRPYIMKYGPKNYLGIDYVLGDGVDLIVDAMFLPERFGENIFDVVMSTEMLEHAEDWRSIVNGMKRVLKPNGLLIITTRSPGFPYHAYPYDYWRYTLDDFNEIFSDLEILVLEPDDSSNPGVLMKARKPLVYSSKCLDNISLFSIIDCRKELQVPKMPIKRKLKIKTINKLSNLKNSFWEKFWS